MGDIAGFAHPSVFLSRTRVSNSKAKKRRKTKVCINVFHCRSNPCANFQLKRLKLKGRRHRTSKPPKMTHWLMTHILRIVYLRLVDCAPSGWPTGSRTSGGFAHCTLYTYNCAHGRIQIICVVLLILCVMITAHRLLLVEFYRIVFFQYSLVDRLHFCV